MSYVVLARKYRPQCFDEVVGQEPIAQTLRNAIASGRVAHAYLFTGPRGVGKTSMARILAMALNCQKADGPTADPCGKCTSCNDIFIGEDVDVREIDGASNNSVEDVRTLRDNAIYHPAHSRFKVYIIDEVHMLSKGAFNALLKTLEEPPDHVKFVFATTEAHKVPETIHSRCQRFDFRNISTDDIVKRLAQICKAEKVKASDDVLRRLARRARGGMRDSQSLLDQVIAFSPEEVTPEALDFVLGTAFDDEIDALFAAFADKNPAAALRVVHDLITAGQDLTEFLVQLAEALRTLMVLKACGRDEKLLDLAAERVEALARAADAFAMDNILYMLQVVAETDRKARTAVEKRIVVESAVVKLASMEDLKPVSEILAELRSLGIEGAAPPARRPASAAQRTETRQTRRDTMPPVEEEPPGEEAVPEPPAGEHKVTASGELGEVQKAWPRLLALLKKKHQRSIAAFLQEAQATALEGDMLTLSFAPGFAFHREQLSDSERLELVEACLAEVTGRPLRVKVEKGEKEAAGKRTEKTSHERSADATAGGSRKPKPPGVQRAVEMFGGRVVEDEG